MTVAAVIALVVPALSLAVMIAVPSGRRGRRAVVREIAVNLIANLVAAAALGLLLGLLGVLHLDRYAAFFALLLLMMPASIILSIVSDILDGLGDSMVTELLFTVLRLIVYLLNLVVVLFGFPIALWQVLDRPDMRGEAVLTVLGMALLIRIAWLREQRLGADGPRVQDLWTVVLVALGPSWLIVGFAIANILTQPNVPQWVRTLYMVLSMIIPFI